MKFRIVFSIFSVICFTTAGQTPIADFTFPSQGLCFDGQINLVNQSANATRYEWDFCDKDFDGTSSVNFLATLTGLGRPLGMDLAYSGGVWYAFLTSWNQGKIYRLTFQNGLNAAPSAITDLGNPGGLMDQPVSIHVVNRSSNWNLLVLNWSTRSIVNVNLGSDIQNNFPTASTIVGTESGGSYPTKMEVLDTPDELKAAIILSNGSMRLIDFKNDLTQTVTPADIVTTSPIPGVSNSETVAFIKDNGTWYAFIGVLSPAAIYRVQFGSNVMFGSIGAPVQVTGANFNGSINNIEITKSGVGYYLHTVTVEGGLFKINIPTITSIPSVSDIIRYGQSTNYSEGYALKFAKDKGHWYGFVFQDNLGSNPKMYQITSSFICGESIKFSSQLSPAISYRYAGNYPVTLRAISADGHDSLVTKSMSISNNPSPTINFIINGRCVNNPVSFSVSSNQTLSTFEWSFGNDSTSSLPSPSSQYPTSGLYNVQVTVNAAGGCQNSSQYSLQIFNPPASAFTLPSTVPLCTNQNYTFTNTSTSDSGSNPTWQWSVNGTAVSTAQDLSYLFTTSSSKSISLTASIPGCSTQSIQNVDSLVDGLLVAFTSPSTACAGAKVSFTNATVGSATSTSWTYGDGNNSSLPDGSNTYDTAGIYSVTLNASNASGCQNSFSKNITIYSLPQPKFDIQAPPLSCTNWPAKFDNNTDVPVDSNISSWLWKFGDTASATSTAKKPSYTYTIAKDYLVSLIATTNVGCVDSIKKTITIFPAPQANFTSNAACINQDTQFDASTSTSTGTITFYQWSVQNNILQGRIPLPYKFTSSDSFPVTLTVRSDNGCLNQITKTINVPVKPVIDFSVQAPCTGHPTFFQEVNPGGADTAVAWSWNFEVGTGTGYRAPFQFPSKKDYYVSMTTKRQSGCAYTKYKYVSIFNGPVANFTPYVLDYGPPLDVSFQNTSTADSYLWQFGDSAQTTSTAISPEFIYKKLGSYKPLLTAYDTLHGCSDTLSTRIDVVIPHIDIVMNTFSLIHNPSSNSSQAVVSLLNSGNIPLVDPEVLINFGNDASVKEKISGLLRPGKSLIQTLALQFIPHALQYICAEIDVANDVNTDNNKQCISLSNEDVVMTPYPNPSSAGYIKLEWVGSAQENVTITVFKSTGEVAFEQKLDEVSSGLGTLTINTSQFSNGLYLIQFAGSKTTKAFRIFIAN